jgi:hypothetical protein
MMTAFGMAHGRCKGPLIETPASKDPFDWLSGDDTGISSRTIWSVMMKRQPESRFDPNVPHDGADFGRCYRLLKRFPAWRPRLAEVAAKYPAWAGLVEHWAEVEALYEAALASPGRRVGAGRSRRYVASAEDNALYERIKQLIGQRP